MRANHGHHATNPSFMAKQRPNMAHALDAASRFCFNRTSSARASDARRSETNPSQVMKMKKKNLLAMEIHFTKQQIASAGRVLMGAGSKLDQNRANDLLRMLVMKAGIVHAVRTVEIARLVEEDRARFDRAEDRREAKLRKQTKWN